MQLCLSCIDSDGREACVWFTDMRYDLLALADTFRYGPSRDGLEVGYEVKFVSGIHRAEKQSLHATTCRRRWRPSRCVPQP